ncbi:MAG: cobalt-precorrin-8X methylmutase [Cyanobacteria bacterium]|nr:cobalt-precorrin-8X methylmutase [Cyanobacteria bacterium CG_2015-16_32_12]NCO78756.1 cobalt-precorrin-8X methylmutase [Cyanobacteria bacterium CG_2015-22_32_23]NCQ03142.1 cobalt-precorrin-8X methylmutase [Cyanobacteria bacterium CG_2015-09_32_10]NCQ41600.1 cobalt-precorrin-8X methylmutase [Cyanobacteria bacterium CG_2015-04_32_10]NCS83625.1 cobalt-precorrin-8X methylmutase [Cyanobacteria bacterium CG_2015-02_32_10]
MKNLTNPIIEKSFAMIDDIIGSHHLTASEYNIARRIIHTTADFDFLNLLQCRNNVIDIAIDALKAKTPIITDVSMVKEGIRSMVAKTYENEIIVAVKQAKQAKKGQTLTETGLLQCCEKYPHGIYVIGNAPTALIALCKQWESQKINPSFVIGAPVGFVSVLQSKAYLGKLDIPQIQIIGHKGGSTVAAAIINALLVMSNG